MEKDDLILRWFFQSAKNSLQQPEWKKIKNWRVKKPMRNIKMFSDFLVKLLAKNPILSKYIEKLYASWKDIMFLYSLYIVANSCPNFEAAKRYATRKYYYNTNIPVVTSYEHISLSTLDRGGEVCEEERDSN